MKRFLLALPLALIVGGCSSSPVQEQSSVATFEANPTVNPAIRTEIEPGVWREEVRLQQKGDAPRIWIYRPTAALDTKSKIKFPCVFIAPAGTTVTSGVALEESARDTHVPYVKANMIVVAYEIDGLSGDKAQAARDFKRARMGLSNSDHAISYTLGHIPNVDPSRLYAVGHSSAGTLALQSAEQDKRIRACVAFAPACNFNFPEAGGGVFENAARQEAAVPGFTRFLRRLMPQANVAKLKCPLFLFSADDDDVVSSAEVQTFARAARSANVKMTFMRVPSGGHVDAMYKAGIPAAVKWLQSLPAPAKKTKVR